MLLGGYLFFVVQEISDGVFGSEDVGFMVFDQVGVHFYFEDVLVGLFLLGFGLGFGEVVLVELVQDVLFGQGDGPVGLQALEHFFQLCYRKSLQKCRIVLFQPPPAQIPNLLLPLFSVNNRLQFRHHIVIQHLILLVKLKRGKILPRRRIVFPVAGFIQSFRRGKYGVDEFGVDVGGLGWGGGGVVVELLCGDLLELVEGWGG